MKKKILYGESPIIWNDIYMFNGAGGGQRTETSVLTNLLLWTQENKEGRGAVYQRTA